MPESKPDRIATPAAAPATAADLLARVTADLSGGTDPTRLLQRFVGPLVQACGAEAGAMKVLTADGARFELVAAQGLPEGLVALESSVDVGCGACGLAARIHDLAWSGAEAPCMRHLQAVAGRRVLALPLAHRGQVLGVCSLFFAPAVAVSPQVLDLLRTLCEVLGLALHGARLEAQALRAALMAERQAVAAEVHDSIAQTLVWAKMRLPLLDAAIEAGDRAAARGYSADLRRAVGDANSGLRELLVQLREAPSAIDLRAVLADSGAALQAQAALELAVDDRAGDLQLSPLQSHQVRRIVQELLQNVARHAGARHVWLTLERAGGELEIRVDDDGSGLPEAPPAADGPHFGLAIVRERAALLGGHIEFARRPQGGTCVRLRVPMAEPS